MGTGLHVPNPALNSEDMLDAMRSVVVWARAYNYSMRFR